MSFLKLPFLPQKKIKLCCIASGNPEIKKALEDLSIEVIECSGTNSIVEPLTNHPDINFAHLGDNKIVCNLENKDLAKKLKKYDFDVITSEKVIKSPYPFDVQLNIARLDNILLINKVTDSHVKFFSETNNLKNVILKQGYVKCTTCIVNEKSIITSDRGTAPILKDVGLDVLLIEEGYIELPGYDFGFIGGCSGLISNNKMVFSGNIEAHPSFHKIKAFLYDRRIDYVSLTKEKLLDIGSIIPLKE